MTKACKACHMIVEEASACPSCAGAEFTERFSSIVAIFDVEKSEVAKKLGAKVPGRYAVKIREH